MSVRIAPMPSDALYESAAQYLGGTTTVEFATATTVHWHCNHQVRSGDTTVSGQLMRIYFPTMTFVKTNEILTP